MPLTTNDRVIRVFVSSTFRDMMQERDLLVKEVFPALRRLCAQRFVTFTEVDLRWGITEEQAREGQVLPLCLAEIERSRPYFIGLLGERYGSIAHDVPEHVLAREPWLCEHLQGRTSVTELEIIHGVLRDPAMDGHAYFYFRDPAYITRLPPDVNPDDYQSENDEAKSKLAALKERILAAQNSGTCICHINYADPQSVGGWILDDFTALINRLYPKAQTPDPLAQERLGHEAHARHKLFACIDRPQHQAALRAYVAQTDRQGKGLVVTGYSGSGKTALLAAWARDWAQDHPDDFLFQHYFGASPSSASPDGFVRRLLSELKQRFNLPDEMPVGSDKLREALPHWLAQTTGRGRIVLVLDGLNQVQGTDAERRLNFLPQFFQPHVKVLASSLPGPALDALRERGWSEHHLPLADAAEIDTMVGEYFRIHARHVDVAGRPLDTPLRRQLVAAPGCKNPLFLRTLLEELRQFGSIEKLPKRVAHYLEADTPPDLFQRVLVRWQEDFDGHDRPRAPGEPGLVRRALTHLWAARQGLSEAEWLDLLGADGEPLPRAHWSPLFLAVEPHLNQRSGLFAFGHDFLRQAVAAAFVPAIDAQWAAHLALADYFAAVPITARSCDELPWQLWQAEERDRLRTCLLEIDRFLEIHKRNHVELMHYWVWLGEERLMGKPYLASFEAWAENPGRQNARLGFVANELGYFLNHGALHLEAEPLCRHVLAINEALYGPDHSDVAVSLNNLAQVLKATSRPREAEPLYRRALAITEGSYGPDHPYVATGLNNLAGLLDDTNRRTEAEPLYRRALAIDEAAFGPDHPDVAIRLNNLAQLLHATNRWADAETMMCRALAIDEASYGPDHPRVATDTSNLAQLLCDTNRRTQAEPLMRRALRIDEASYGPDHPAVATDLNNLASLLHATNRLAEAEPLMRRALTITEVTYGSDHPKFATRLNNLAQLLHATNRLAEAEPLMRRALAITEASFGPDHSDVAGCLINLAGLLYATRRLIDAEPLMRRALAITEATYGPEHPKVAISLNNLAQLLQATDRLAEADALMRRALAITKASFGPDHPEVAIRLSNLALLRTATKQLAEAEPLFRSALTIDEEAYGPLHPRVATDLYNLARFLQETNRLGEAEPLMRRALTIDETSYGPEHPHVARQLNNLAGLLTTTNRLTEAEPLFRRALAIDEASFGPQHPTVATRLNNLARLLHETNRQAAAEPPMRRALAIDEASYGPQHPAVARDLNNLASLLQATNRLGEAEPLMRRALAIDEASYGPNHPHVATGLNNLAQLLRATNRLAEAEPLYRRALVIDEASFGPDHPDVANDLNNLAQFLRAMNRLAEAEPLMRRAVEILLKFNAQTGQPHPQLQAMLGNYAGLRHALEQDDKEIAVYCRQVAAAKQLDLHQLPARAKVDFATHIVAYVGQIDLSSLSTPDQVSLYRRALGIAERL